MYDVEIVMPVYNEAACITEVIHDWVKELDALGISYRLMVLNDGSRDATAEALKMHAGNPRVKVINKSNSGHGPTILQGYRSAVDEASWVFQVDSDNEMEAKHFKKMWSARNTCDAVIGVRDGRLQPLSRKIISIISSRIVILFYGQGVQDVNCPFRLMKSGVLKLFLDRIPQDTFAPNVAISGLFALEKKIVANVPIPHHARQTGEVSIKKWKLFKAAMISCVQVVIIRVKIKRYAHAS
ncbi:MAG: glycosyltransferase family 2 protein [Pseudomonadota bacterium]